MTYFILPNTAKPWFKHILGNKESGFSLDFDMYYFCLMAGLHKSRKDPLPKKDTTDLLLYFPQEYTTHRHFIIALFLKTELDYLSIKLNEKKALDKELSRLIDPAAPARLSDEGMKELNNYAFGGLRVLQDNFPESPRTLDVFLVEFYRFLNDGNNKL